MSEMTKAEVERIVGVWQERLGLAHWNIAVRWEMPVSKGDDAEIHISNDYEQASIRVQQDDDPTTDPQTKPFTGWTIEYTNYTIVHELLHIFEKQTKRAAESLEGVIPGSVYDVFSAWYEHGAENWVDRLARQIVAIGGCA